MSADAYWRRRLFALAAGLAVLGLLAWAVGGASAPRQTAAARSLHHQDQHGNLPATGGLPAISASPSPTSSPSPSPSPSQTGGPRGHAHGGKHAGQDAKPRAKPTAGAAAPGTHGTGCPAADVVITLTASSNSYAPAARPKFGVDVVSTASRTCTFNAGTKYLTLLIESGGVRVWKSADCAGRSGASSVTKLRRGVPLQLSFTWDRLLSSPGCAPPRPAARPGTYTVTASDGHLHSHTLVFVLR